MDSPLFVIQEDGRYGSAGDGPNVFDEALDQASLETGLRRPMLGAVIPARRFFLAAMIVEFVFGAFLMRAAFLQIANGASYRALAERNRVHVRVIDAPRGAILDRNGRVLASNVPTFVLTLRAAALPHANQNDTPEKAGLADTERARILTRVAALAGLQRADMDLAISQFAGMDEEIAVKRGLSYESAMRLAVELPSLPGFGLYTSSIRFYDSSARSLSHVLGYTGSISAEEYATLKGKGYRPLDALGKTGLEKTAETLLRGMPGQTVVEVDARGTELKLIAHQDPVPGAELQVAIDGNLQQFIETYLAETLASARVKKGAVVAIDPRDGAVRALVSWPAFDANRFVQGLNVADYQTLVDDPMQPLFPRAVSGEYPAGSTFKPFVAYAALKEGIVNEHTSFLSTGGLRVGPWFFPDWKVGGHGLTDVRKALAWSINTFFYIVGGGYEGVTGLGVERLAHHARAFGFGAKTGIDLPGEATGFLPSKEWKEKVKNEQWYVGDTYHFAIGQGDLLATPIQIAGALSVIANGGKRVTPHIVETANGKRVFPPPAPDIVFDASAINVIRQGMRQAATSGSARLLADLPIPVAGKTGTAQPGGDIATHGWFMGFGPYEKPNIALVVLAENGGEGSSVAVPLAKQIFAWWFAHGHAAD